MFLSLGLLQAVSGQHMVILRPVCPVLPLSLSLSELPVVNAHLEDAEALQVLTGGVIQEHDPPSKMPPSLILLC